MTILWELLTFTLTYLCHEIVSILKIYYHPPTKLREGNVFNCGSLFTGGSHVTITCDALDLTSVTSGGQDWKPVQTCSLEDPPTHQGWHLVATGYGWQVGGTQRIRTLL